jgi:hypothetical protein
MSLARELIPDLPNLRSFLENLTNCMPQNPLYFLNSYSSDFHIPDIESLAENNSSCYLK